MKASTSAKILSWILVILPMALIALCAFKVTAIRFQNPDFSETRLFFASWPWVVTGLVGVVFYLLLSDLKGRIFHEVEYRRHLGLDLNSNFFKEDIMLESTFVCTDTEKRTVAGGGYSHTATLVPASSEKINGVVLRLIRFETLGAPPFEAGKRYKISIGSSDGESALDPDLHKG